MRRPLLAALVGLTIAPGTRAQEPVVRARLFAAAPPRTVTLRAVGGPVTLRADDDTRTLAPGVEATLASAARGVRVTMPGWDEEGREVEVTPEGDARLSLASGRTRRSYHGALLIRDDGAALRLVNVLPMEDYVASVVAGEYPFPEVEGVKAQAVLARTYAAQRRGLHGDHDVVDSVMDQVYPGADAETALTRRAAAETRGEVLAYGGGLAEVFYSSSNGGHSANNDEVWGRAPLPYLRARPDPYDAVSPDRSWTTRVEASRLHAALGRRFGGRVTGFSVAERTAEGRALRVRMDGAQRAEVSGQEFRMATIQELGGRLVRSTLFEARREGSEYVFEGRGFGHGVGLSQYGAHGQAQRGRSYRDILAFYFAGTTLAPMDHLATGTPLVADAAPVADTRRPARRLPRTAEDGAHLEEALRQLREQEARGAATPPTPAAAGWTGQPERTGGGRRRAW